MTKVQPPELRWQETPVGGGVEVRFAGPSAGTTKSPALALGVLLSLLGVVVCLLALAGNVPKTVQPVTMLLAGAGAIAVGVAAFALAPRTGSFAGRIRVGDGRLVVIGGGWLERELVVALAPAPSFSVETTSSTMRAGTDFDQYGQAQSFGEATEYAYAILVTARGLRASPVALFRDRACAAWMAERLASLCGGTFTGF